MVKLILLNSAPPGQESQKCLENSATDLVTSRLREVMKSDREVTKSDREVTKALVFCERWPSPWYYFRDIFGSPGQEEPNWAKWVSPSISSMKTTTFKPNLYFCHRIPLIHMKTKVVQHVPRINRHRQRHIYGQRHSHRHRWFPALVNNMGIFFTNYYFSQCTPSPPPRSLD